MVELVIQQIAAAFHLDKWATWPSRFMEKATPCPHRGFARMRAGSI